MPLERVDSPAVRLTDPEYAQEYGDEYARASLAVCLATARREAGVSQTELARRIGKSQPYVSKLESGEANPTVGAVGRILACMGRQLVCDTEPLPGGERATRGGRPYVRTQSYAGLRGAASVSGVAEPQLDDGRPESRRHGA